MDTYDSEVDVLVVGSGAGGMVAALTAQSEGMSVRLIEKSSYYGGSTAMSGGGIWAPNNPVLVQAGIKDSVEETLQYLQQVTKGEVPEARLRVYAAKSGEMIRFLQSISPTMKFVYSRGYSDYHPEYTHGHPEGRSIEAEPFDLKRLGTDRHAMRPSDISIPLGMWLTASEFRALSMVMRTMQGKLTALRIGLRTAANWLTGRHMVALGSSLVGRLRLTMKERGVPLELDTSLEDVVIEQGRLVGAVLGHDGTPERVRVRRGLVVATGGFDHNQELRDKWLPTTARLGMSAGSPSDVGDAVGIAERHGLQLGLMDDAWWMPSVQLPNGKLFTLVSERAIPRSVIVGMDGERFTNEASPYVNFVHDQLASGNEYVWQVLDSKALARYMYAGKPPGVPIPKAWIECGMVVRGKTFEELADKMGVPPQAFARTMAEYNRDAKTGIDLLFRRGESAYDRYYGDPTLSNPVVDTVDVGPYVAFKVLPGDIGTKGGIVTDEHARALDTSGVPIEGLYVTGNASASVMGRDYAGAGATIGPSMTFGYVAACHAAEAAHASS